VGDSDFVNNQLPTQLDGASATVNGQSGYVYYISPMRINILTPPAALPADAPIVVSNNGGSSASFAALTQTLSTSFLFLAMECTLRPSTPMELWWGRRASLYRAIPFPRPSPERRSLSTRTVSGSPQFP
jgi:hypothetical protein